MKSRLEKVYGKLPNQKVELSLIQDLDSEFDKIINATETLLDVQKELSTLIFNFRDDINAYSASSYIEIIGDYRNSMIELGLEPDTKYQDAIDNWLEVKDYAVNTYIN